MSQERTPHAAGPGRMGRGAAARSKRTVGPLVLLFLAFTTLVVGTAYAYHRAFARAVRSQREQELETIARLKVEQIQALRRERLGNGRTIHENPGMSRASWPLLEKHDRRAVEAHLEGWFAPLASHYGYSDVVVLDDRLDVMTRWDSGAAELPSHSRAVAERALNDGTVRLADPRREPGTNALMLDLAVPLVARGGPRPDRIVGVLLFRAAVADTLQPIVDGWPTPTATGSMVLVGRQGDNLVYLTEPRAGEARGSSLPLSRAGVPAVQAVLGGAGILEGRDASGTPVVAAARRVPDTDWVLLAQMDASELMAPVAATDRALALAVVALLASAALSLAFLRHRQLESARRDVALRDTERLEHQFAALFEHASDAVLVVDESGKVLAANNRVAELYGWKREEIPGRHAGEVVGRADGEVEASFKAAHDRGRIVVERIHRRRDGSPLPVEASIQSYSVNGSRYGLAIVRDISERKRNEAQLRLTDRLSAMGALAAGVAHEINNPLSFVLGNLEWALERLPGDGGEGVRTALEEARDGARRVQEIVGDLKTFSRSEEGSESRRAIDVVPVIRSSLNIAQNQLRHRARLVTDLQPVPAVEASEQRLGQVFLNLFINAAHAIPRNATAENTIYVGTRTAPDGGVVVEVRDTGEGMSPEVMRRIFEPFFTTKAGEGTGLGLSICHGIVRSLGGRIEVESAPGRGSTFRVVLPRATRDAEPPARERPAPDSPSRPGRVLIVDDEPLVASSMARLLGRAHQVVTVTSARDALARVEAGEDYDVILCDLMMPEMTGMELWAALARVRPGIEQRMVFITGGTFTDRAREFLEGTANAWLEKPFEAAALRDAVAEGLRARAARATG